MVAWFRDEALHTNAPLLFKLQPAESLAYSKANLGPTQRLYFVNESLQLCFLLMSLDTYMYLFFACVCSVVHLLIRALWSSWACQ